MTPDEVVKELEIHYQTNCMVGDIGVAIKTAITLIQDYTRMRDYAQECCTKSSKAEKLIQDYQKLRENLPNEEELYKFIHNWLCKRHGIEYNGILARDLAHTIINKNGGAREGIRQDQSESETST